MKLSFAPLATAAITTALLTSNISAYAADLKLEEFFKGTTHAYGNFKAINGKQREFRVLLNGKWNGKTLVLREDFFYKDGERDVKTWRFTKTSPTTYTGTREDVKGTTKVTVKGNNIVDIDNGPKTNFVRFRDVLTLKKDGTIRNTAIVSKLGLPVAKVAVNFARTKQQALAIKPK